MEKTFVEEWDAVIHSDLFPKLEDGHEPKEGETVPHQHEVSSVMYYVPIYDNDGRIKAHKQIWLNKGFVITLADKIKELESKIQHLPYSELPF